MHVKLSCHLEFLRKNENYWGWWHRMVAGQLYNCSLRLLASHTAFCLSHVPSLCFTSFLFIQSINNTTVNPLASRVPFFFLLLVSKHSILKCPLIASSPAECLLCVMFSSITISHTSPEISIFIQHNIIAKRKLCGKGYWRHFICSQHTEVFFSHAFPGLSQLSKEI